MKNKILAFLLVMCLAVGTVVSVPRTSYAASNYTSSKAVMFLTKLDIMKEDMYTGEFWNDSFVKRFEVAQILCKLFDYDVKAGGEKMFNDVGEADRAYVETVVRNGLMSGYGDGKFGPNDYVTNEQIVKIFVDVIGGKDYASMLGGYPMGYLVAANRLGIGSRLGLSSDQYARRIDVANVIYDTLHVDLIQLKGYTDGYANYGMVDGETLLSERLNISIIKGEVTAIDSTSTNRATGGTGDAAVNIGSETILDPEYMADYYLGSSVVAYAKENRATEEKTLIYIEESSSNSIIEVNGSDIIDVNSSRITYYIENKKRDAKISAITDMVYNGKAISFDGSKLQNSSDIAVRMVDNDNDGIIDCVNVTEYKNYVITRYKSESETLYFDFGDRPLTLNDSFVRVFVDGVAVAPEKMEEAMEAGLVASVAVSNDDGTKKAIRIECSSTGVMGALSSLYNESGVDYATIEGKEYRINPRAAALAASNMLPEIKAGINGQFYLNINNEIVYFTGGSESGAVGYLVDVYIDSSSFSPDAKFKIYTDKGKMEVYSAKDKIRINDTLIKLENLASDSLWIDLCSEAAGKQIIKYTVSDGVMEEIIYCSSTPQYDSQKFSLDVEGSFYVQKQGTLGYTYSVDSETKVFYVPSDGSDAIEKYKVLNGSYFKRDKTYNVSLYDLTPQGKVSYAVVRANGASVLTIDNTFILVTDVMKGLDDDGVVIDVIEGYTTAGNLVQAKAMPGFELCDSSDSTRIVEKGDVILYCNNVLGYIEEIKVVQKLSDVIHNGIGTVITADRQTSFGYAANVSDSRFLVTETKPAGQISPLEAKAVIASGGSVFLITKERGKIEPAAYTDIVSGDEVFTLGNASNTTMMIVIYR